MARLVDDAVEPVPAPMRAHVAGCARCTATAARLARLGEALQRAGAPLAQAKAPRVFVPPTPPAELMPATLRPAPPRLRRAWWIGPLAAAAILTFVVIAQRSLRPRHDPAEPPILVQRDAAPTADVNSAAPAGGNENPKEATGEFALAATAFAVENDPVEIESGTPIGAPGLVFVAMDEWDSNWVDASMRQHEASNGWEITAPLSPSLTVESQWTDEEIELLEPWSDFHENVDEGELDLRGDRGLDDDAEIMG
ncbi:MAG: hypothetical protein IT449_16735 [Phycisphaerales bacterium]|nr:hypothetical protein [Phycisphaerales bacterium]